MDASEVLLWLLLVAVAVSGVLLSFYGCAGVADEEEDVTNPSQDTTTSASRVVFGSSAAKRKKSVSDRIVLVPELVPINPMQQSSATRVR